ncbi:MAG TPA: hypothetical protein VF939_27035 [Puia sp.]
MKDSIPLKRFEYCISDTAATVQFANVDIDFEKKNLSLTGGSLKVKATIYPGCAVDLSDSSEDELVFSLEGIMEDGKSINSCSGLLVLDSMMSRYELGGKEWHATVYLYDDYNDEREIKLKLPMCSLSENAELN